MNVSDKNSCECVRVQNEKTVPECKRLCVCVSIHSRRVMLGKRMNVCISV